MKKVIYETDWLAANPVFYNEQTGAASHNIHEVIDYTSCEIDAEGSNDFLDFSYSVFQQTPVKHVKFLRHSARLWRDDSGKLTVEYLADPVDKWLDRRISESDIFDLLTAKIGAWENSGTGDIVIPTSGGLDSRLLNVLIQDKSRIRSFSYGVSPEQDSSFEVVYAKMLSQTLGTRWEQIPLGDYHRYLDDWDQLFGVSTHAHGMYHIEFYKKVLHRVESNARLLSGIIGDAWAGSVNIPTLQDVGDLPCLGYAHGVRADSARSHFRSDRIAWHAYFTDQRERLRDPRIRVVEAMRFKIILLSYLLRVPRALGFQPWSPFLDIEVAMSMLNLPEERRRNRLWQREYFHRRGLDFEATNPSASKYITLDLQALNRVPPPPLNVRLLSKVVVPDYVCWINRHMLRRGPLWEWFWRISPALLHLRGTWRAMRTLGLNDDRLNAYSAYVTLKPIEYLLQKRGDAT